MSKGISTCDATVIGVDIGGTKILGVALDSSGTVLAEVRIPTPNDSSKDDVLTRDVSTRDVLTRSVVEIISSLADRAQLTETKIGIGIGVPGMIDKTGVAIFAPNLSQVVGIDFAQILTHEFNNCVVTIDNDANFAAFAEHRLGSIKDIAQAIVVTIGTGIGCGLIIDGDIYHGARGFGGEAGHMIVEHRGKLCKCTRRGCWEAYASGTALGEQTRNAATTGRLPDIFELVDGKVQDLRGEHLIKLASTGNTVALEILEEFSWWIALGLANITALTDPEVIVLAGGLFGGPAGGPAGGPTGGPTGTENLLLGPVTQAFSELAEGYSSRPKIKIMLADLGESAGAIGAALAALSAMRVPPKESLENADAGNARHLRSKASSS